ncbi:hypothetical protein GCM10009864_67410 [Streptomyces lunalinharesii]|uniref:Transposase n=1 Tax=Streptomyces lunalinharesii TaxID=333384 RepID=A0ABN3SWC4_9ACTN
MVEEIAYVQDARMRPDRATIEKSPDSVRRIVDTTLRGEYDCSSLSWDGKRGAVSAGENRGMRCLSRRAEFKVSEEPPYDALTQCHPV